MNRIIENIELPAFKKGFNPGSYASKALDNPRRTAPA